jgi:xanthine dehydrogenase YagS FAD-binding subunit
MKTFHHVNAKTIAQASAVLEVGRAALIAGGTDLLGTLKDNILPDYPDMVVNIKTIPGLGTIREEEGGLVIGALTRLADIAASPLVREQAKALAEAAQAAASPHIREMGTIAGNLCQLPRCWYFRKPENRFPCLRKGGTECYAVTGEHKFHSVFGAVCGCIAINNSDLAPALIALDAVIITNSRPIPIQDLFDVKNRAPYTTALEPGEIITEIRIPAQPSESKSIFRKFAFRRSIDFPVVNLAIRTGESPRIVLNAVYPKPVRAEEAEALLREVFAERKNVLSGEFAEKIGEAAVLSVRPLPDTKYKAQIAKTLIKRALLEVFAK